MQRIGFLIFTVAVILTLVKLGSWQLTRATQKETLTVALQQRGELEYLSVSNLPSDPRWHRLSVRGQFDSTRGILLDNQMYQGRVGYQVLYPFSTRHHWFLVNLGWIAAPPYRDQWPTLPQIYGEVSISGIVSTPEPLLELSSPSIWPPYYPLRVQNLLLPRLSEHVNYPLMPWILQLESQSPFALQPTWQPVVMGPQKHYGYAMQWFCLAFAVFLSAGWWLYRSRI